MIKDDSSIALDRPDSTVPFDQKSSQIALSDMCDDWDPAPHRRHEVEN
jgi:hypothetical protein